MLYLYVFIYKSKKLLQQKTLRTAFLMNAFQALRSCYLSVFNFQFSSSGKFPTFVM